MNFLLRGDRSAVRGYIPGMTVSGYRAALVAMGIVGGTASLDHKRSGKLRGRALSWPSEERLEFTRKGQKGEKWEEPEHVYGEGT